MVSHSDQQVAKDEVVYTVQRYAIALPSYNHGRRKCVCVGGGGGQRTRPPVDKSAGARPLEMRIFQ